MSTRNRFAALGAALAACAALVGPATASAATVPMRGVVSGSPYNASGGQMAVPVLFSKMTARNVGLRSPVGVIIMSKKQLVKMPNGLPKIVPINLRTGDRFKGFGEVGRLQRVVFYPRVVFPKATVYFRSKELSLAELSAAIDALRKGLADLQKQITDLTGATIAAWKQLADQLAALQRQLASLQIPGAVDLSGIQKQIDDLNASLNGVIGSLANYALKTDLPDLSGFLTSGDLPDLSGFLTAADLPDLSGFLTAADIAGLLDATEVQDLIDTTVAGLPSLQDVNDAISTATNGLASTTAVTNAINSATAGLATQAELDATKDQLADVCTSLESATVDPDGAGVLPAVPITLPGIGAACP